MAGPPPLGPLDNETTAILKWADYFQEPVLSLLVTEIDAAGNPRLPAPFLSPPLGIQTTYRSLVPSTYQVELERVTTGSLTERWNEISRDFRPLYPQALLRTLIESYLIVAGGVGTDADVTGLIDWYNSTYEATETVDLSDIRSALRLRPAYLDTDQFRLTRTIEASFARFNRPPRDASPLTIDSISYGYYVTHRDYGELNWAAYLQIWSLTSATDRLPIVLLRRNDDTHLRYWRGVNLAQLETMAKLIRLRGVTNPPIGFSLYVVPTGATLETLAPEDLILVQIDLASNTATLALTGTTTAEEVSAVVEETGGFQLGARVIGSTKATFYLYGSALERAAFFRATLLRAPFIDHHYFGEANTPIATRRFKIYHRYPLYFDLNRVFPPPPDSAYARASFVFLENVRIPSSVRVNETTYRASSTAVLVTVSRADSVESLEQVRAYLAYLWPLLPPPPPTLQVAPPRLRQINPTLFPSRFSRRCQTAIEVIQPEDVPEWTARGRQTLPFPPNAPEVIIACPDDNNPFPGVIIQEAEPGRSPYIACCYPVDQTLIGGSLYQLKTGQVGPLRRRGEAYQPTGVRFVIESGHSGAIPDRLSRYLTKISGKSFMRYGVTSRLTSFLEAVWLAALPGYAADTSQGRRLTREREIRVWQAFRPAVNAGELSEFSDADIQAMKADPTLFVDPRLFIHGLELQYHLNILVVTEDGFLLPRYTTYPLRDWLLDPATQTAAPLLLVYFYRPSNTGPRAEPLISRDDRQFLIRDPAVIISFFQQYLYQYDLSLYSVADERVVRAEPGGNWDLSTYFPQFQLTGQVLDQSGKSRIQYWTTGGVMNPVEWETHTAPLAPTNADRAPRRVVPAPPYTTIAALYDPAVVAAQSREEQVVSTADGTTAESYLIGIWIDAGGNSLYLPVATAALDLPLPLRPPLVVPLPKPELAARREVDYQLRILLQYCQWLYQLEVLTVEDFFEQAVLVGNEAEPPYDLTNIEVNLPEVTSLAEGLEFVERSAPGLVRDGRLYLYSARFGAGVKYFLEQYRLGNYDTPLLAEISGVYTTPDRVLLTDAEIILPTTFLYNQWRSVVNSPSVSIRPEIPSSSEVNPVVIESGSQRYLLQNSGLGDLASALYIVDNWGMYLVNIGHDPVAVPPVAGTWQAVHWVDGALRPAVVLAERPVATRVVLEYPLERRWAALLYLDDMEAPAR